MLDLNRTSGSYTPVEYALDPLVRPLESGLAYVRIADANGNEVITISKGVANESFVGVAYMDKIAASNGVRYGYVLKVPKTGAQTIVLPDGLGIANLKINDTVSGVIAPADYTLVGSVVTFANASHADHEVEVFYNYTLTEMQKAALGISPIASGSEFLGSLAVLTGVVRTFISNFDADAAWAIDADVSLAPNGFFTIGGSGSVVAKCVKVPTAQDPFLGISYIAH